MFESYYNLKRSPFQLTSDPGFFFNSKTHKRALSYLLFGLKQEEGFIVITGDVGTGKTTLVSHLINKVEKKNFIIANIVNSNLQEEDLLLLISAELGLQYKDMSKARLIKNINLFLRSCYNEGKRVLLIIDEAQNLPVESLEELRMLTNLQVKGKPLMQCFLLGQKQFRKSLQSENLRQLRQRIIATHYLLPLDEQETNDYIKHRLMLAGWNHDPQIDGDVITGIYEFTGGIPRMINLICSRILLYGCVEEIHHIDYAAFQEVIEDVKHEYWNEMNEAII